ncbi:MAG: HPr family phosphocarrier protein [Myxococcota bacterium]
MNDGQTVEKTFVVRSALGLHARPAGRLASIAGRFESEISLGRGEEWVSGSSVLSILCLAATQGTEISVRAVGADAEQAVLELGALIEAPDEA